MGFIWNTMRFARVPEHVLTLQETDGTLSKQWPILWHFGQYWCLLKVNDAGVRQPYYLYRSDGKRIARYYLLIHTPYVMVQVGPEPTYFWAETRTHKPLILTATGIKKAGILVRKKPKGVAKVLKDHLFTKA